MNRNRFLNSRRFKYGSVATAFTIAFIAIVVIFNIIFTALAQKYMWYIDMTEQQVFTLSEEAKEIMSDITEDVYIYFASEPDVLMNGTNSSYTRYIYTTALQLEEEFPNVHVDAISVLKNPSFFKEFYNTTATDIDTTSVVITSGNETRVVRAQAFHNLHKVGKVETLCCGERYAVHNDFVVCTRDLTHLADLIAIATQQHVHVAVHVKEFCLDFLLLIASYDDERYALVKKQRGKKVTLYVKLKRPVFILKI